MTFVASKGPNSQSVQIVSVRLLFQLNTLQGLSALFYKVCAIVVADMILAKEPLE